MILLYWFQSASVGFRVRLELRSSGGPIALELRLWVRGSSLLWLAVGLDSDRCSLTSMAAGSEGVDERDKASPTWVLRGAARGGEEGRVGGTGRETLAAGAGRRGRGGRAEVKRSCCLAWKTEWRADEIWAARMGIARWEGERESEGGPLFNVSRRRGRRPGASSEV